MQQVYNTGKVKIGLAYQPKMVVHHDRDACRLQAALLYGAALDRAAARQRAEARRREAPRLLRLSRLSAGWLSWLGARHA